MQPDTIELDVHVHLAPVDPERLVAFVGVEWQSDPPVLRVDGFPLAIAALFSPRQLISWMDRRGVARALVSVPPPLYRQALAPDAAARWAEYLNDGLLAFAARHADRLAALLHLPLEHPAVALHVQQHYIERGPAGVAGFALAAGGDPRIVFSDPAIAPLWRALDARGDFVFVHPGACTDRRLATYYLENLLGNPLETSVAAAHLVMAGVPSRFPGIRFCLAHAGGAFPSLVGRLERGFETRRPGVDLDVERPRTAARRLYADGIAHDPAALHLAREIFGDDHVLFGSDWPFPMGLPERREGEP